MRTPISAFGNLHVRPLYPTRKPAPFSTLQALDQTGACIVPFAGRQESDFALYYPFTTRFFPCFDPDILWFGIDYLILADTLVSHEAEVRGQTAVHHARIRSFRDHSRGERKSQAHCLTTAPLANSFISRRFFAPRTINNRRANSASHPSLILAGKHIPVMWNAHASLYCTGPTTSSARLASKPYTPCNRWSNKALSTIHHAIASKHDEGYPAGQGMSVLNEGGMYHTPLTCV